jgi:uncharacterized protein YkwD
MSAMNRYILAVAIASTMGLTFAPAFTHDDSARRSHAVLGVTLPMVRASQASEAPMTIAFVNPHAPQTVVDQSLALAEDVNKERTSRGLPALTRDATLDSFAYAEAAQMASRGYFGHTDPDGVTFQDRLRAWHWPNAYAAENIAFDRDEPHAHSAFMNSPGHRSNVLDPNERRIGVAVVTVGDHETFYVEDFSAN